MNTSTRVLAFFLSSLLLLPSCTSSSASYESLTTDGGLGFDVADDGAGVHYGPETWWELGDSLTYGVGTTPVTGYRLPLWQWAKGTRCKVTFEGTITTGDWENPVHDGHPGFSVEGLQGELTHVWGTHLPEADLVILMVGTNNMGNLSTVPYEPEAVTAHYINLVEAIDADVLVTTIPPAPPMVPYAKNVDDYNRRIVAAWDVIDAKRTRKLYRAQVNLVLAPWKQADYLQSPNLHLTKLGYSKVAAEFERVLAPRCPLL